MARLLRLGPGEIQLTELMPQELTLSSQFGVKSYIAWCRAESERINLSRGTNNSVVYTNGGKKCCIVVTRRNS